MNKPPVVLVVQNELDAPIGYLEEWLFERGVGIEVIYPFKETLFQQNLVNLLE
jgi:hypothetical protein